MGNLPKRICGVPGACVARRLGHTNRRWIYHSSACGTINRMVFRAATADGDRDAAKAAGGSVVRAWRAWRDAERRPREAIDSAAPAARGVFASAPGAWRARVCIAFIIMVVSCAVRVLVGL